MDFLKSKVKNAKDFNSFIKYLKDDSKKEERKQIYIEHFGALDILAKAKFITEVVSPYFTDLLMKAQSALESSKEDILCDKLKTLSTSFNKIRDVLPDDEQKNIVLKTVSEKYSSDSIEEFVDLILNYKKNVSEFNRSLFDMLLEQVEEAETTKQTLNIEQFNAKLEQPDLVDKIKVKNYRNNLNDDSIDNIFISSILKAIPSINMESLGKLYAYVNCSWAQKDLVDKDTWKDSDAAKSLFTILDDIKYNPDEILSFEEVENRNNKLLTSFTERINEICLSVVIRKNGQLDISNSNLKPYLVAGSGQPDIFMQDALNKNKFVSVHCTANELLKYTADQEKDASSMRHASMLKRHLLGRKVSDLNSKSFDLMNSLIDDVEIKEIEEVVMAPSLITGSHNRIEGFEAYFKNTLFSKREVTMVSLFPLLDLWVKHVPSSSLEKEGDILNIDKMIFVGLEQDTWQQVVDKYKRYNEESRYKKFINGFVIDYIQETISMLVNHKIKKGAEVGNIYSKSIKHKQTQFLDFLPRLLNKVYRIQEKQKLLSPESIGKLNTSTEFILSLYENLEFKDDSTVTNIAALRGYKIKLENELSSDPSIKLIKEAIRKIKV